MRTPVENITMLQKQINDLQLENQILKDLLEHSGIPYRQETARIRERGSSIRSRSRMKWQICFTPGSGGGRTSTQREARRKVPVKRDTTRSAGTFGRRYVRKRTAEK